MINFKNMRIQCTDRKTFELSDDSKPLGAVTYDSLFSLKANATIGNNLYVVTPKGIFSTTISVTKMGAEIASLQMNWKGNIIISFSKGEEYLLKATGLFLNKFVLEDKDQQKIMILDADFNWSKFSYNYTIAYDNKPQDILLVLLASYGANYFIASMSSGG